MPSINAVGTAAPELSIIVPILNEAATLLVLLAMLGRQERVEFELILCDGGSNDGTYEQARSLGSVSWFPCRVLRSERGRARQMNSGARAAAAEFLLFLHADSDFPDPLALRKGLDTLLDCGNEKAAGHYALRFDLPAEKRSFGYYFHECKARLDRPECTHGDQGFLLRNALFAELGPFDETLPLAEDTRLAEAIRRGGDWLLLPAEILTSARRFEAEGLAARQTLNALLMNFSAIGWEDFFRAAPAVYRRQDLADRLRLLPYFQLIRRLLCQLPWRQRLMLWYRTGAYVRPNAWQLAFYADARRNFRYGLPAGEGKTPRLCWFDRWYGPLTDHPPGRLATAGLVWLWFHLFRIWLSVGEKRKGQEQ